jgi:hypothetical protein
MYPSIHGGFEVVDDPVGRQPLDALVEVLRHLEGEIPLMVAGADLVRLVLAAIGWEQVDMLDEEVCLMRNGLRAHGIG